MGILLNSFKTWAFCCIICKLWANAYFLLVYTQQIHAGLAPRFSKLIGYFSSCCSISSCNYTTYSFSHKMITYSYMFNSPMKHMIRSKMNCCLVVAKYIYIMGSLDNWHSNLKLKYNKARGQTDIKQQHKNYNKSSLKICWSGGGVTPFQICACPESLAALANACATLLPSLFKHWKEQLENEHERVLISLRMWPTLPPKSSMVKAWIIESASDSKIARGIYISNAKMTP